MLKEWDEVFIGSNLATLIAAKKAWDQGMRNLAVINPDIDFQAEPSEFPFDSLVADEIPFLDSTYSLKLPDVRERISRWREIFPGPVVARQAPGPMPQSKEELEIRLRTLVILGPEYLNGMDLEAQQLWCMERGHRFMLLEGQNALSRFPGVSTTKQGLARMDYRVQAGLEMGPTVEMDLTSYRLALLSFFRERLEKNGDFLSQATQIQFQGSKLSFMNSKGVRKEGIVKKYLTVSVSPSFRGFVRTAFPQDSELRTILSRELSTLKVVEDAHWSVLSKDALPTEWVGRRRNLVAYANWNNPQILEVWRLGAEESGSSGVETLFELSRAFEHLWGWSRLSIRNFRNAKRFFLETPEVRIPPEGRGNVRLLLGAEGSFQRVFEGAMKVQQNDR